MPLNLGLLPENKIPDELRPSETTLIYPLSIEELSQREKCSCGSLFTIRKGVVFPSLIDHGDRLHFMAFFYCSMECLLDCWDPEEARWTVNEYFTFEQQPFWQN